MKILISFFLVLVVLGVSFSSFLIAKGGNAEHISCIIAAIARLQGVSCPSGGESFSFVNFHFDFLKSFSNIFVLDNMVDLLTIVLLAILFTVFSAVFLNRTNFLAFAPIKFSDDRKFLSRRFFVRYLSFLENSPNKF